MKLSNIVGSKVSTKGIQVLFRACGVVAVVGGIISMIEYRDINYYQSRSEASLACDAWKKRGKEVELSNPFDTSKDRLSRQIRSWNRECAFDDIKEAFLGLEIKDSMALQNYAKAIQSRETKALFEIRNPKNTKEVK